MSRASSVSYTHLRAHETDSYLVCRLLLEKTPLQLRVFSSQLLGIDSELVLHGGGNTSVKLRETNIFGEEEDILYVKGSGRNLATIDIEGFTPLRMTHMNKLAELVHISDIMMVREQQFAMTNPHAPYLSLIHI